LFAPKIGAELIRLTPPVSLDGLTGRGLVVDTATATPVRQVSGEPDRSDLESE
jgi:hypothetical protein